MENFNVNANPLVDALRDALPAVIMRSNWDRLREKHGLPYTGKTLANMDSKGEGPRSHKLNGLVGYTREDVLEWLEHRETNRLTHLRPPQHDSSPHREIPTE